MWARICPKTNCLLKMKNYLNWFKEPLTLWLLSPLLFRKTSDKPSVLPTSRRLWLSLSPFPSQKVPNCCSRTVFCTGMAPQSTPLPQPIHDLKRRRRCKDDPLHALLVDIAPVDLFLCLRVKSEMVGVLLSQDSFKTSSDGVIQTIARDEFCKAIQRWMDCCEKCTKICSD